MKIKEYALQKGVEFRYSYQIAPTIEGKTYNFEHRLSPTEIVKHEMEDKERQLFWSAKEKVKIENVPYGELPIYNCKTAKFTFCVSSDMMLSGCIHDRVNTYDLRKGTFNKGWKAVNDIIESKMITPLFLCASCEYLPFCNTCPADAERQFEDINNVDPFNCELAQLRYKKFTGRCNNEV